jgi:hypothetical protein
VKNTITVVCCIAKTDQQAQSIREELGLLGYHDCFEERIQLHEFWISVRLHSPSEKALMMETLQKAGGVEITAWKERAA